MRKMHLKCGWIAVLAVGLAGGVAGGQTLPYDPDVEAAIERYKQALRNAQVDDHWPAQDKQETGPTGLAVYALLEAGVKPQEPNLAAALKWLTRQKEEYTYSLACRILAYAAAEQTQRGEYRKYITQDVKQLYLSMNNGLIRYAAPGLPGKGEWDNSNMQYALLGLWIASECGIEVPQKYWQVTERHWRSTQRDDGGWTYTGEGKKGHSTGTMTAAGIASLFVCGDRLGAGGVNCTGANLPKPLQDGLAWLDENFTTHPKDAKFRGYCLYGIERVGLASGYKFFGQHDWYDEGASLLAGAGRAARAGVKSGIKPPAAGKKLDVPNAAFSLLFLCRGRHPVVFNKLQYSGDWNNRPRALAYLTGWMSRMLERTVAWQIIDAAHPVSQWHDAPILVISGAKAPTFTDAELDKLRTYVQQGGTILSIRECSGEGFGTGMRDVYRRLFPDYELKTCGRDHPLYAKSVYFDVPATIPLAVISNGVRPLVIHTDADLMLSWQSLRTTSQKEHFELAMNIMRYVATGPHLMRHRGVSHWPDPAGPAASVRTAQLVRLQHSGSFDPEPLAFRRLSLLMRSLAGTDLDVTGPIPIADLPSGRAKLASLTGTGKLDLSAAERATLVAFVKGGGTLVIDAAGGDKTFAASTAGVLGEMFPQAPAELVPATDPLFQRPGFTIDSFTYRHHGDSRAGPGPQLQAVRLDGRTAVLFSPDDLSIGLLGTHSLTIDGYTPQTAWEIMRNVVLSTAADKPVPESKPKDNRKARRR